MPRRGLCSDKPILSRELTWRLRTGCLLGLFPSVVSCKPPEDCGTPLLGLARRSASACRNLLAPEDRHKPNHTLTSPDGGRSLACGQFRPFGAEDFRDTSCRKDGQ